MAALEIAVNKACEAWEIELGDKDNRFEKRLEKVVEKLKSFGEDISKVEKGFQKSVYNLRGEVLHAGLVPNDEDFSRIIREIPNFIQKIKKHIK